MARIFMMGFEDGSIGTPSVVGTGSASTAQKRTGAYSMLVARNEASYTEYYLPAAKSELYIRFGIYQTDTTSSIWYETLQLRGASDTMFTVQFYPPSNLINLRLGGYTGTVLCATPAGSVSVNTWYTVELHIKVDNSAGVAQMKLNGVATAEFSGDTQVGSDTGITRFRCYSSSTGWCSNKYFDDIAFNDVSGGVNDSWIGSGGIVALKPNGAGVNTDLTPSTGDNYACVDEVPASDTDYVSSTVADDYDLYAVDESVLPATGIISAIKWIARAKVASDTANIAPVIRTGGVLYGTTEQQADIALSTSYAVQSLIMDENPIDDDAWSVEDVSSMEIGAAIG